ncbi:hypothetical protein BCR34DRAFT_499874 [Clohesyomyces aquaticus]|uniref:protein-tyrosine-phosphatase n=1 Tax=Clohesyomyces aquaticus TaxID=1231657 RepID=A0A1Y1Y6G9_9PLEO|nr:hypothetical protein BCR34DRAFT_499874 [Clohesyomyces aquaticus]
MDSSSVTDPSPGPSPESPVAKVASSFVPDFRSRRTADSPSDPSQSAFFELQRPMTPAKKPRNLKNLGINTASSLGNLRSNAPAPLALGIPAKKEKITSAPTSPSFIKPPTPPKRRPSNLSLTIQTPGTDSKPMRLIIPSTPAALQRPTLRHFQSSPSLPLCSPSVAPSGGMNLPVLRPIKTNPHGFAEVPIEVEEEEDQEPNFDIPQSREEKPAAYPHGPICIYEQGVYLYFEPTAEQASNYDVIINVASEVKNPFTVSDEVSQKELDARRVDGPPAEVVDFAAIPERPKASSIDTQSSSPTTPKATPILDAIQPEQPATVTTGLPIPEYVHMKWEHNTDIVPDLFKLVKLIDDRVQQEKRVLIHCQCGVSRSASLIVAYGLYKNPGISVQEAYDAVKKRSKWIGPNMNLIMQLQEFRNGLLRANGDRNFHNQVFGLPRRSAGLPSGMSSTTNRHSPFDMEVANGSRTPRTAPLPPDSDITMQRASTGNMMAISPGPMSAPSGVFFSPGYRRSWASSPAKPHFDLSPTSSPTDPAALYVDPKGHSVPVLSITNNDVSKADAPSVQATPRESLKAPSVPNFSRQLPFRQHADYDHSGETLLPGSADFHTAPLQPGGFGALRSPMVSSFNIPPVGLNSHIDDAPLMSPIKQGFNLAPWPQANNAGFHSSSRSIEHQAEQMSLSPRSSEFHMTSLEPGHIDESYQLLSPRSTTFDFGRKQASSPSNRSSRDFEVASPTTTGFPKDIWARTDDAMDFEVSSPRATEFHMTPLKPKVPVVEDPFGLTSPKKFEFPRDPFENAQVTPPRGTQQEDENRRPSFQAILPPSHLTQPEASNGFTSLNGFAAQAQPMQPTIVGPVPSMDFEPLRISNAQGRIDSLNLSSQPQPIELPEPHTPGFDTSRGQGPGARLTPQQAFLSTPPRHPTIRTRFSSPNMREQRRLQKLQTEMEALLPTRSPGLPQAADDLDALMSPRAEEFTRNPFHVDLKANVEDTSPASSNETIKDGRVGSEWKETPQWTPPKILDEDPRSPVQTGSSPIVRNIWDVL